MARSSGMKNTPSTTGNKSGKGRNNNPPRTVSSDSKSSASNTKCTKK